MTTDYTTTIHQLLNQGYGLRLSTLADTAIVEYFDGGHEDLLTRYAPITTVTAIVNTDDNSTLAATSYSYDPDRGFIYLEQQNDFVFANVGDPIWTEGRRLWKVTYKAGYVTVPAVVSNAVSMWSNWLNENEKGATSVKIGDFSESFGADGMAMPANVKALLAPYLRFRI